MMQGFGLPEQFFRFIPRGRAFGRCLEDKDVLFTFEYGFVLYDCLLYTSDAADE